MLSYALGDHLQEILRGYEFSRDDSLAFVTNAYFNRIVTERIAQAHAGFVRDGKLVRDDLVRERLDADRQ